MRSIVMLVVAAWCASGGEYAVLSTGFRIHASGHVADGDKIRLTTATGVIEVPASRVAAFEQEEYAPAPAAPPPAAAVVSAPPEKALTTREMITEAAKQAGLPPALVHSLVSAESGYRVKALSPKGAIGLMQLMPGTAAALNADPYDPKQNVEAGVAYLKDLLARYEDDPHQVTKAVAAYNAGPGAVDRYNGIPPYAETIQYVSRVVRQYMNAQGSR